MDWQTTRSEYRSAMYLVKKKLHARLQGFNLALIATTAYFYREKSMLSHKSGQLVLANAAVAVDYSHYNVYRQASWVPSRVENDPDVRLGDQPCPEMIGYAGDFVVNAVER